MGESTQFVILCQHRSGTTALCEMLNDHPDVLCHYEVFDVNFPPVRRSLAPGLTDSDLLLRETDPVSFVRRIYEESGDKKAIGFKMAKNQNPPMCMELLRRTDVCKIVLERSNSLARYSSHLFLMRDKVVRLKKRRGLHQGNPSLDISPLTQFDAEKFLTFYHTQKLTFEFYRENMTGPNMWISYEQFSIDGLVDVFPFLGVKAMSINNRHLKMHTSNILSRFDKSLHPLISDTLERIGHPEWTLEFQKTA